MATSQPRGGENPSKKVRKSLMVEADKLERARKLLGVSSDAEVLRVALDHLLSGVADRPARAGGGGAEEE
jgi:hypothetical protein